MRVIMGPLLGQAAGYSPGFYDGRHLTEPSVLRMAKSFEKPAIPSVQRAESLKADAEAKLRKNADEKMNAAER
mgnify:CR=1 FL=1